MKKHTFILAFLFFTLFLFTRSHAQCDTVASVCAKHIIVPYISDGQQFRALLLAGQNAEFHTTFYGGGSYRVAACTGMNDGKLIFSVFDQERNLLFSNKDYSNAPYWDFKVKSTLNVILEATLAGAESGCAVVMLGFK